jgi:23S rRNA pseudouridine1911/1915/1917 synthase
VTEFPTPETPSGKDRHIDITVPPQGKGMRIDIFLASCLPGNPSRTSVKSLIGEGHVAVNGGVCAASNHRLRIDDRIRVEIPEPAETEFEGEDIKLDILFEDEFLIVINKPAGMVVHPAPGNWSGTLVNALIHHCGDSLRGIGGTRRPGIVHRLDQHTSGVIVAAKTEAAHQGLANQFADRDKRAMLRRHYLAVAWGEFDRPQGVVDAPLGRAPANRIKRAVVNADRPDARPAITRYNVVARLDGNSDGIADASLVECRLDTGRTHQIRVHLAHVGHPLIGDPLYGAHFRTKEKTLTEPARSAVAQFGRQALHAASLGFRHPASGEQMLFEAPMPDDMVRLLAAFARLD